MNIEDCLSMIPKVEYISTFDPKPSTGWEDVKALWYEGAPYKGKQTKVFAYIGYPKMKAGEKVPAVVLVHGGGGHAFAHWVKIWNERGYAAISMDVDGYIPNAEWKGLVGTEGQGYDKYTQELYDELEDENYILGPGNDEILTTDLPQEEQWIYHAVVDTILAHNILIGDERIDSDKVGITGVSWGSVITSIAIGYDTRYAFAIPIYGSAYLEYADTKVCRAFKQQQVREMWGAANRLKNANFPILWMCGLYDNAFCSYSNSLSYADTKKKGSVLSIQESLIHSHVDGWSREESYRFADSVLKEKSGFVEVMREPTGFGEIHVPIRVPEDIENLTVRVVYFTEDFQFNEKSQILNKAKTVPAMLERNLVRASIPKEAYSYYVEFVGYANGKEIISTTTWVTRKRI